jgi:hypothetical protein
MTSSLPRDLAERPRDERYGVPVPFASEQDGHVDLGEVDLGEVVKKRAIQCALSRICGLCGRSLSWGVTFVGSEAEAAGNAFHYPPLHEACAEAALEIYPPLGVPVLGQAEVLAEWALVVTGGFELERPASRQGDTRVVFHANSITQIRQVLG